MQPLDLIKTAELLVSSHPNKPSQSNLRRATSTSYYALFHTLARCSADLLVGGVGSKRSDSAWRQVYRALEHGVINTSCKKKDVLKKFPKAIEDFANAFVTMQSKRHESDYDPKPKNKLTKSEVLADIQIVKSVINKFSKVKIKDRRAFCVLIIFKNRT